MLSDVYQSWLDGLARGEVVSAPPMPDPQQLLEQLSAQNPKLATMMRLMNMRRQAESTPEAEQDMPQDESRVALDSSAQSIDQQDIEVERVLRRLYAEVDELRTRNDTLAAALGACYLCWGQNPDCPECYGRGKPGSIQPDRDCFLEWVGPALHRLRVGASQDRPKNERNNHSPVNQKTVGDPESHNPIQK